MKAKEIKEATTKRIMAKYGFNTEQANAMIDEHEKLCLYYKYPYTIDYFCKQIKQIGKDIGSFGATKEEAHNAFIALRKI